MTSNLNAKFDLFNLRTNCRIKRILRVRRINYFVLLKNPLAAKETIDFVSTRLIFDEPVVWC